MPAFNAMLARWSKLQDTLLQYHEIIDAGIEKLRQYQDRLTTVPVYALSIHKFLLISFFQFQLIHVVPVINPVMKLEWFRRNMPHQVEPVRELFMTHVSILSTMY
jgi:hypothetical protein